MLCVLQISLELSLKAKGDMILREASYPVEPDPSIAARFRELEFLEKSIGKAGRRALDPLLTLSARDLWEMHRLNDDTWLS
jgi:hypothetical protein